MKKQFFSALLALILLLSLFSCESETGNTNTFVPETSLLEEEVSTEDTEKKETEEAAFPFIEEKFKPEDLYAIPIATSSMSVDQLRQICLDYFRLQLSFSWTPDRDFSYVVTSQNHPVTLRRGVLYGGIPYQTIGTGNLYRVLENYDPETGVMTISQNTLKFFNQCSVGAFWGWGRVINSADYTWTQHMTKKNGFIPVAPCDYDPSNFVFGESGCKDTGEICRDNGKQTMFQAYANLRPADGLVDPGHVRMVSSVPEVVYKTDGSGEIDGRLSRLRYCDQKMPWSVTTQSDGSIKNVQGGVDVSISFDLLYASEALPFTFKEFLGLDPVEKAQVSIDVEKDALTCRELAKGTVTSNYTISDTFITVKNEKGEAVFTFAGRCNDANVKTMPLTSVVYPNMVEKYEADGLHTAEISCQLSTGEKIVVFTGKLIS